MMLEIERILRYFSINIKYKETHLPSPAHKQTTYKPRPHQSSKPTHINLPSPPTALGGSFYKYPAAQQTHGTQSMGF